MRLITLLPLTLLLSVAALAQDPQPEPDPPRPAPPKDERRDPTEADPELKKAMESSQPKTEPARGQRTRPQRPTLRALPPFKLKARLLGPKLALALVEIDKQIVQLRLGDKLAVAGLRLEVSKLDRHELRIKVQPHNVEVVVR